MNQSTGLFLYVRVDRQRPFISGMHPYLEVDSSGTSARLHIYFSEQLYDILSPADGLLIYTKNSIPGQEIAANLLFTHNNELIGKFGAPALDSLNKWVQQGETPLLRLSANTVTDIAGNTNLKLNNVQFNIVSPSIIEYLDNLNIFFSPNQDGRNDTLSLDISFTDTEEKYLSFCVYDPTNEGTIISFINKKIENNLTEFYSDDSIYSIKRIGPREVRILWNGRDENTKEFVGEGDYIIKLSGSINDNYSEQFPIILNAKIDYTKPIIRSIIPAFGNKGLTLNENSVIKVYLNEPIYLQPNYHENNPYLTAELNIVNWPDSVFIADSSLFNQEMIVKTDSVLQEEYMAKDRKSLDELKNSLKRC